MLYTKSSGVKAAARCLILAVLLPILYVIEPFWRFRFGIIRADRMTIVSGPQLFIRRLELKGKPKRTTWVFFATNPCNEQLFKMFKRALTIIDNIFLNKIMHLILPVFEKTRFYISLQNNSCHYEEMFKWDCPLHFTDEEEKFGKLKLLEMGITDNDWFACIYNRSPEYIASVKGDMANTSSNAHRDCSIENFIPSAKWIASQGGFVLRIGSAVDSALPYTGEAKIIDYASHFRSDFMDVYLTAKCRLFIGCLSGMTDLSRAFNVPVAWTNSSYCSLGIGENSLIIPKFLRNKDTGKILKFSEISALGIFPNAADPECKINYSRYGLDVIGELSYLEWVENDQEDILNITMDVMDIVCQVPPPEEAVKFQQRYLAYFGSSPHNSPYVAPLAPRFALRHKDLFD
jgi:putative glycosyltransferase (TIGR04372 family)